MTNPMTPSRLAEIKARCEAASEGPWYENFSIQSGSQIVAADSPICLIQEGCTERGYANMLFLSGARSDLPDCIAEIERLQELVRVAYREGGNTGRATIGSVCPFDEGNCFWDTSEARKALAT